MARVNPASTRQRMARHIDILWRKFQYTDMTLDEMYDRLIAFPTVEQVRDFKAYGIRLDRNACRKCNKERLRYFLRTFKQDRKRPFHYIPLGSTKHEGEQEQSGGYWIYVDGLAYLTSIGKVPLQRTLEDLERLAIILNTKGQGALATAIAVMKVHTELEAGKTFEQPRLLGSGPDVTPELIAG